MPYSKSFKKRIRQISSESGLTYAAALNLERVRMRNEARPFILSVVGYKGGIGRTTAAISIATEMHERGARVLLMELVEPPAVRGGMWGLDFWRERCRVAGQRTPDVRRYDYRHVNTQEFASLIGEYDLVVIDCMRDPMIEYAAMLASDTSLICCKPWDVHGPLGDTPATADVARESNPKLRTVALLINRIPTWKTYLGKIRSLAAHLNVPMMRTELCHRRAVYEAIEAGLPLTRYAPNGRAAKELASVIGELWPEGSSELRRVAGDYLPLAVRLPSEDELSARKQRYSYSERLRTFRVN